MTRLQGKSALVTGAGSGFGEAIAKRFAAEGARVAVNDLDAAKAETVATAIRAAGGEAVAAPGNAAKSESVAAMIAACVAAYGRMDLLVLNAGVAQRPTPIESMEEAAFERIFDANVRSVFLGAKHAQPQFKAQGGGAIVVTASTIATRPRPGLGIYAASKGAAISLTKALALDPELLGHYPFCRLKEPANVLVMPGLYSATISSKLLQKLGGASVIGPILVGLSKPVTDAEVLQKLLTDTNLGEQIGDAWLAAHPA